MQACDLGKPEEIKEAPHVRMLELCATDRSIVWNCSINMHRRCSKSLKLAGNFIKSNTWLTAESLLLRTDCWYWLLRTESCVLTTKSWLLSADNWKLTDGHWLLRAAGWWLVYTTNIKHKKLTGIFWEVPDMCQWCKLCPHQLCHPCHPHNKCIFYSHLPHQGSSTTWPLELNHDMMGDVTNVVNVNIRFWSSEAVESATKASPKASSSTAAAPTAAAPTVIQ